MHDRPVNEVVEEGFETVAWKPGRSGIGWLAALIITREVTRSG